MITPKETEKEFDKFFRQINYDRVFDDVGSSPGFNNADYVNQTKRIIVELKVLDEERMPDGGIINCLNSIIIKPEQINEYGYGSYSLELPEPDKNGRLDSGLRKSLISVLKKANKQLRETKSFYCNDSEFTGYVILAHSGFMSLSPEVTSGVVTDILNTQFSSIDGALICTPHYNLVNSLTRRLDYPYVLVAKKLDTLLSNQCLELSNDWYDFYLKGGHTKAF